MTNSERQEPEAAEFVRPYVIADGRDLPDGDQFSLITLVTAAANHGGRRLLPEEQSLLEMCSAATSRSPRSRDTCACPWAW